MEASARDGAGGGAGIGMDDVDGAGGGGPDDIIGGGGPDIGGGADAITGGGGAHSRSHRSSLALGGGAQSSSGNILLDDNTGDDERSRRAEERTELDEINSSNSWILLLVDVGALTVWESNDGPGMVLALVLVVVVQVAFGTYVPTMIHVYSTIQHID
jgi:hypothetical protein